MEESEENMSSEDTRKVDSSSAVKKPKKRSMVERELVTNMTARVTSPAAAGEALSTSRYGRARRLKTDTELIESQKVLLASIKSPGNENTPVKVQSPVYRMHASNSPHKAESPTKSLVTYLDNQIDNIYQENISLSRFSDETSTPSPAKKFPKVYVRKDLIQNREEEETIMLIKNLFSPTKSTSKFSNTPSDRAELSTEKYNAKQNGHVDNSSVVKTLDFDSTKKKKKDDKEKASLSKNELFELEAKCLYQVGDLAWARVGTFPFWPCIVTREPNSEIFVKRKLFGRVEHDIVHVTFFGDNGRRSWIVDNMLRKYLGQLEFHTTRDKFTTEDKKKDPKLYAAFFVSEKKQALWNISVEEAETLSREPKRLRIDIFNDMLWKSRASKKNAKSGKISRTNSDVSLSESLYDSLFSEKEINADDTERSKKSRNKSFDVSEVVTACLDNMAAKTGITKIQRQSHMDRWLQKAKSKTPEKTQAKPVAIKSEKPDKILKKTSPPIKLNRKSGSKLKTNQPVLPLSVGHTKPYRFRRMESHSKLSQIDSKKDSITRPDEINSNNCEINLITIAAKNNNCGQDISTAIIIEDDESLKKISPMEIDPVVQNTSGLVIDSTEDTVKVNKIEQLVNKVIDVDLSNPTKLPLNEHKNPDNHANIEIITCDDQAVVENSTNQTNGTLSDVDKAKNSEYVGNQFVDVSSADITSLQSKNELNVNTFAQPIQDIQISEKVKVAEITVKAVEVDSENMDAPSNHPHRTELCKESLDVPVEHNSKISVSDLSQDSAMEVDENIDDHEKVKDNNKKKKIEPAKDFRMEIDKCTDFKIQGNEDTSHNSKTVSNMSVEDNVTDLKETQNIVTIEVSVTEKKNDDTINYLPQEGEEESIDKPNPSQLTSPKIDTVIFLDKSQDKSISETNNVIAADNATPEKYKGLIQKSRTNSPEKFHVKNKISFLKSFDTFRDDVIATKYDEKNIILSTNDECIDKDVSVYDEISYSDKTTNCRNTVLNESGNSVSFLQLCDVDPEIEKSKEILNTTFSDSIRSESVLESCQINENRDEKISKESFEIAENISNNETECMAEENCNDTTRQDVESPTFTQLLDSEEFFLEVNETHTNFTKLKNENSEPCPESQEIISNKVKKNKTVESYKVIENIDEEDDTSEEEPSPEYESLDDEITEDFRKHMMSIESNIKDKKDEEQIVKICNEIAEKAKLSPTKYTQDAEMASKTHKIETDSKIVPVTNLKRRLDVKLKDDETIQRAKGDTNPLDKQHIKVDKHGSISRDKKQNKTKSLHKVTTKDLIYLENQIKTDIPLDIVPEKSNNRILSKEDNIMINGNTTLLEMAEPKIMYRTRLSVSSATKERDSPEIKVESSQVGQYRKSCEYEPKVVIIRLERDKIDCSKGTNKAKPLEENQSKSDSDSRISLSISPDDKLVENKIIENEEAKSAHRKSRLSLKRDSPKTKPELNKIVQNCISVTKEDNSESLQLKATAIIAKATAKVPNKLEIRNDACETAIPEPVKINGYHHNLDRKHADTPDSIGDTDFDVDAVSLNSEDSEVSLSNSIQLIPRRNLRPRPERTLEYALNNPEFLKYLELRQDYLMDLHPELNEDEVVSYVHKTWQYEEDLKSDTKKIDYEHNSPKQETPSRSKKSKKSQPKNSIENHLRENYEKSKCNEIDAETAVVVNSIEAVEQKADSDPKEIICKSETPDKPKKHSESPQSVDLTSETDTALVMDTYKDVEFLSIKSEENLTPRKSSRSRMTPKSLNKEIYDLEEKAAPEGNLKKERDIDNESIDSEDSEIPLRLLRSRALRENNGNKFTTEPSPENKVDKVSVGKETTLKEIKDEIDDTVSTVSENEPLVKQKKSKTDKNSIKDPGFIQYLELKQDALMDENPQLKHEEIVQYLHNIWLYEENSKSALEKNNELEQQANSVKGVNNNEVAPAKKIRRKAKAEKQEDSELLPKQKPRRRIPQPFYNENYSDIEEELDVFEIFKTKKTALTVVPKADVEKAKSPTSKTGKEESLKFTPQTKQPQIVKNETDQANQDEGEVEYIDETEIYFTDLTKPKPNVFKGLIREKVCEICECVVNLVKCKGCYGMFHPDCVKIQSEAKEKAKEPELPSKGRKKKRKPIRKPRGPEDSESHSDDKSHDMSADTSIEEIVPPEIYTIDAEYFESKLEAKMKEMINVSDANYDSYSSDDGVDWGNTVAGKCEIVDVKLKKREPPIDYSDFKCNNCQKYDVPVCFVCKSAASKTGIELRQKCHVAHCHKHYHLECLDHWPQTQFNSGEPSRNSKRKNEFLEALTCPRHVCHTCVSDDPRGCKTRFSGDKLAKCVRCPATYHSFNKCMPAGSQVLTASHIICPRHSEQKAGKVPCHVNTGWCFICAQGGSLICCEYCPTSFHAECLNIKPPEGNYMCEDCETGRLPLYGEMVWVKLGQYRWWPGIILHPSEIPENIMLVKHELGDFVVRFFGQYDHYWVNRGRVFPYQEGDSGRISSQKSKINADFILAIEHAQRAYTILKNAAPDGDESLDIASSLLPPQYVKLRSNKPSGALSGRRAEDPSLSLTQCECNPDDAEPCGPYSQCLNRMLLTECGPSCRAGERCRNRAFERRLYPKLTPYRTPQRGWGLKTLEDIKAGQFVIEYVGELIDEAEFRRRMRRKHEIRDENFYFLTLDKERMIDAGPKGNAARFMNHCCEPNCETQKWTVLGDVRVGLFAIQDIPANSEVTFNYNLECAGIEKKRCLCGAGRCSGYIGAKPKQDESQVKKGREGKVKRAYNKKKKPEESPPTIKMKKRLGRPPKPKELTELEKDVLIIKNATNLSSDESTNAEDKPKKRSSNTTEQVSLCNGPVEDKIKSLKRKRISISTEEVSICNGQEPSVKRLKCDKPSEVGD